MINFKYKFSRFTIELMQFNSVGNLINDFQSKHLIN